MRHQALKVVVVLIKNVTDQFSVADQIELSDLSHIAELGFKAIVNNRPDAEEEGQLSDAVLAEATSKLGLAYLHIPIAGMSLPDAAELIAYSRQMSELPSPVLAFCRSGNRAVRLWAAVNADKFAITDMIRDTAAVGYDIGDIEEQLQTLAVVLADSGR